MKLKELTLQDREAVTELFRGVFSAEPWNDDWSDEEQLNAYIDDLAGQRNSLTLGYFDGSRLAALSMGCIKHWHEGTEYSIEEFCVDTQLQGRGIGSGFMKAIEAYLAERHICRIFIQTDRNVPACAFYRSRGFHELEDHVSFIRFTDE